MSFDDAPTPARPEPLPDPMAPERRRLLEAANTLTECGSILSMVEHGKRDEGTRRANNSRFLAVEGRLKAVRKAIKALEVEYNRQGWL